MGVTSTVILILGIIVLVEGLWIITFPKTVKRLINHFAKNSKKWGIIEIVAGIILILISLTI